jgi:hypothetical protein
MNSINRVFPNILKPIEGATVGGVQEAIAKKVHVPSVLDLATFNDSLQSAITSLPKQGTISSQTDLIRVFGRIGVEPPPIQASSGEFRDDLLRVSGWNAHKVTDSRLSRIIEKVATLPEHFKGKAQTIIDRIEGRRQEYGGLENATAARNGQELLDIIEASENRNRW